MRVLFSESTGARSRDSFSVIGRGEWQLRYFCAFALYGEMIIFRLDRLRLGKTANSACLCARLARLCGDKPRLDRLRLGKMQTSLFLPSACTIFVEPRTVCITSVRKNRIETEL